MDYNTILLLIGAVIVMLALLIIAGLFLPVRSYTLLLDLVAQLGSLVKAQTAAHQQAVTNLLDATVQLQSSVLKAVSHITPVEAASTTKESGSKETE